MTDRLIGEIERLGSAAKIVPAERLGDIRRDLEDLKSGNELNGFQKFILSGIYRLDIPDCGFPVRSVVVTATPTPALARLVFEREGKRIPLLLPYGYVTKETIPVELENTMNGFLSPIGFHVKFAPGLPHKLLAARSGLGRYGRNNIVYVEGMGSYLVLAPYYSDIPCGEGGWSEINQMDECTGCRACLNACPMGAIRTDRFLIDNEICLTNLNEGAGYPFPDWVKPSAHNCIVGCHRCQTACPADKGHSDKIVELAEFSEKETFILLEGAPKEQLPEELLKKLETLNLVNYLGALPRNLKALLDRIS